MRGVSCPVVSRGVGLLVVLMSPTSFSVLPCGIVAWPLGWSSIIVFLIQVGSCQVTEPDTHPPEEAAMAAKACEIL